MIPTAIILNGHIDPTVLHTSTKIQPTASYFTHNCQICSWNKYASQMPYISHICQLFHVHMRHLCQYLHHIHTHCSPECDQRHWYTSISYYWHMPLNKHAYDTVCVHPTSFLLQISYRPHITANINKKSTNYNIYHTTAKCVYQHQICPSNAKYIPHAQITYHILKGKYANRAIYEVPPINDVVRTTQHRWCRTMLMMSQPSYICWIGHLAKSVKMHTGGYYLCTYPSQISKILKKYFMSHWQKSTFTKVTINKKK